MTCVVTDACIKLALSELPHIAELALEGPATIMLGKVFAAVEENASLPAPRRWLATAR